MNRTDRLLGILLELQAHGERTAAALAGRFEVSQRTIYRDMQALAETGVPLAALPGRGYRLMPGYFLPPLSLTAGEAAVLALGGEFIRERVDPELRRTADEALHKLLTVLPPQRREEVAAWRRALLFPARPVRDDARLAGLRAAVQASQVLRIVYQAHRQAAPAPREVEPTRLVYWGDAWYLSAYCRLRRGPRLFRLDRIDGWRATGERFTPGERHRLSSPPGADGAEVHVRFEPPAERWARERPPYFFRREEATAAGSVFVYAARDEEQLLHWLLGWGTAVAAVEPAAMRRRLAAAAAAIAAKLGQATPAPDRLVSAVPLYPGGRADEGSAR